MPAAGKAIFLRPSEVNEHGGLKASSSPTALPPSEGVARDGASLISNILHLSAAIWKRRRGFHVRYVRLRRIHARSGSRFEARDGNGGAHGCADARRTPRSGAGVMEGGIAAGTVVEGIGA